jgi:hypothetical protein
MQSTTTTKDIRVGESLYILRPDHIIASLLEKGALASFAGLVDMDPCVLAVFKVAEGTEGYDVDVWFGDGFVDVQVMQPDCAPFKAPPSMRRLVDIAIS